MDGLGSGGSTKIVGQDKHVESVWLPRLDEGSIPSSSTGKTEKGKDFQCEVLSFYYKYVVVLLRFSQKIGCKREFGFVDINRKLYLCRQFNT